MAKPAPEVEAVAAGAVVEQPFRQWKGDTAQELAEVSRRGYGSKRLPKSVLAAIKREAIAASVTREKTATEERVDTIVKRMADGEWFAGASHLELAEDWDVTVSVVERCAAEANRVIRRFVHEDDGVEIRTRYLATLEGVKRRALGRKPNYKAVIAAIELQSKLLGLITTKVDATVRDPSAMTDGEARAALEAAVARAQKTLVGT